LKKLKSYKDLQVGKIYNRVYTGDNEAYARINGKKTFAVISISPEFKIQTLFDQFGSIFSNELRSKEITISDLEKAFAEYEFYEVENSNEYFVKSQFMTLQEALEQDLITFTEIKEKTDSRNITSINFGKGWYIKFHVEGRSKTNIYLQTVFVKWTSREKMESDFSQIGFTLK